MERRGKENVGCCKKKNRAVYISINNSGCVLPPVPLLCVSNSFLPWPKFSSYTEAHRMIDHVLDFSFPGEIQAIKKQKAQQFFIHNFAFFPLKSMMTPKHPSIAEVHAGFKLKYISSI